LTDRGCASSSSCAVAACAAAIATIPTPGAWVSDGDEALTADELLDRAERYRSYWGKQGGITVSGGEALLQMDFLIDLFRESPTSGASTPASTPQRSPSRARSLSSVSSPA
jgi:pyruvate-formate lyase-activating enzyme